VTAFDAFQKAACPWRVSVAIYQELENGDLDSFRAYANLVRIHGTRDFSDRLRVRSLDNAESTSIGVLGAIREAIEQMWQDETYVLLMEPGVAMVDRWDDYYIRELGAAEGNVLSHVPAPIASSVAESQHVVERESNASSSSHPASQIVRLVLGRVGAHASIGSVNHEGVSVEGGKSGATATFTTLGPFEHRIPEVRSATFPFSHREVPTPCLAVSVDNVFMRADMLRRAIDTNPSTFERPIARYAADVALSSALWRSGASLQAPSKVAAWKGKPDARLYRFRPRGWRETQIDLDPDYALFAGIDAKSRVTSGRAMMGLLPGDDDDGISQTDVIAKYGSRSEFDRIRRSYT